MFERYVLKAPEAADSARGQTMGQNKNQARGHERTALRAFGWSELTARIDAARDLRRVLRNDALVEATSFADAAGGYFVSEGNHKQRVNPNALEASKGLADITVAAPTPSAKGGQES